MKVSLVSSSGTSFSMLPQKPYIGTQVAHAQAVNVVERYLYLSTLFECLGTWLYNVMSNPFKSSMFQRCDRYLGYLHTCVDCRYLGPCNYICTKVIC